MLKSKCPSNATIAGTAYCFKGGDWWSYDTPGTIAGKVSYAKNQGLGGAFFWELSGDTSNGELISAIKKGIGRPVTDLLLNGAVAVETRPGFVGAVRHEAVHMTADDGAVARMVVRAGHFPPVRTNIA